MGVLDGKRPEPEEKIEYMAVHGSFDCQFCYEDVEEASYSYQTRELGWVCSQGHISRIQDFVL